MKTLIKTNEFGKVTKAFYTQTQGAKDAEGSFLNDCTISRSARKKRTVEIIDFEFEKYGFSKMPTFANFKINNLGLFVVGVFRSLGGGYFSSTNQVTEL